MLHSQRVVTCSVHLWHSMFCKYYMLSHFSPFSTLNISSMRHYALSYYIDVMLLNEVEHCCLILHGIVTHSNALYGNAWYCNIFHGPLLHWYYRNDIEWLESHTGSCHVYLTQIPLSASSIFGRRRSSSDLNMLQLVKSRLTPCSVIFLNRVDLSLMLCHVLSTLSRPIKRGNTFASSK